MIKRNQKFLLKSFRVAVMVLISNIYLISSTNLCAQKIHKFERISVVDGLSQNFVQSILCDDKGFLWFGTWDGLNRYDGRQFKIFKVDPKQKNSLTNNRIIDLWQDKQHKIWVKTNDGYIHYFIDETYEFITFPYYLKSLEERNSTITCFWENNQQEVLLGSTNSGLYFLKYNEKSDRYDERQFLNRGTSTISDNRISFISSDKNEDIWIGTLKGLNHISRNELNKESPSFSNFWLDYEFTTGYYLDSILLLGTINNGIKIHETNTGKFENAPDLFKDLAQKSISLIQRSSKDILLIGTQSSGLYIFNLKNRKIQKQFLPGKQIKKIFQDSYHTFWINTQEFGIYHLDSSLMKIEHFELIPKSIQSIVDDERQFIYEDSQPQRNLWIALHGGGLAHFNRELNEFEFYRNIPNDNSTISSDNVYCIAEDQSGMLWVGTGTPRGGVNKIYTTNEAFQRIPLEEQVLSGNENIVRSILIDENNHTWVGTKAGNMYILDTDYQVIKKFYQIPTIHGTIPGQNAYTMIQDKDGFIWIGTKGGGVFVTEFALTKDTYQYNNLRFINYLHNPDDSNSLSSNIIYSIIEDTLGRIWIGSYEGGLNLVTERNNNDLKCLHINTSNTNLTSNLVRYMIEDHEGKLWIATAFGVNYLNLKNFTINNPIIHPQLYDPRRSTSLSYNDVIHLYEDSKNQLWFGTSGGGINKLTSGTRDSLIFEHINTTDGLINDVVYGILEDISGDIWFSTDHGISRYNPSLGTFDNFDQSNNLSTDAFNENTCNITTDGKLVFGTNDGLLIVKPDLIVKNDFKPFVALTNFQLFNKDIDINDPESPLKQDIETVDQIVLKYFQSSFSIEYAAMSYYAPTKNKYAFMLENFDQQWNEVGNQNKATYTNLAPGNYVFKVKAANWNSDWSDKTRSVAITILPPWWKTTPMYITYFILFIIVFEIIRRSYLRYHQLQNDLKVEKRVNDIKLQFFTNISHEIRTPLTLILGPIHDLIEIKNIPKNIAAKLYLIEKNGKRMLRLVNQLLDFRKIQKNKMDLKVHKIELVSFIKSIVENFDLIAEHKKIKIVFNTTHENLDVWVDPNKFDSVIFNILSNALKFNPEKGIVTVQIESRNKAFIDIMIKDQGAGIPKNRISQIFQRFSPLSKENEEFGSSGIGLAYSYEIMKLHRGEILLHSESGKGSEFIVRILTGSEHFNEEEIQMDIGESLYTIKHEKVDEEEATELNERDYIEKQYHILLVEDNHQILNYLKENLTENYHISTCHNGKEALKFINENLPDLVITDIMMPVMNGIVLTQRLKDALDTSHIPIIMLTAKSSMEDQIEGIESGAEAYILKPFNMVYVRAVVDNLLKQREIIHLKYIHNKVNGYSEIKITTKDEKFLTDVTQLIMDNYSDPEFNIEKLVENSYVSRTVFYHKIKSLTGLTPIDFLRQKRLHIAAQLLINSDYNISEIALFSGFNDVKNFSRRFKEIYKMTPTQYKEEMIGQKTDV